MSKSDIPTHHEHPGNRQLTDDEIRDFERKLRDWGESLPPAQRGILALILDRAAQHEHGEFDGVAVAVWNERVSGLLGPYLKHIYALADTDGGTPDGGWVSWAAKLE